MWKNLRSNFKNFRSNISIGKKFDNYLDGYANHPKKIRIENINSGDRKIDRKKFIFKIGWNSKSAVYNIYIVTNKCRRKPIGRWRKERRRAAADCLLTINYLPLTICLIQQSTLDSSWSLFKMLRVATWMNELLPTTIMPV